MHLQLFLQMEKFKQIFSNILKHFVNHISTSSNIVGPNAAFVPICYEESYERSNKCFKNAYISA